MSESLQPPINLEQVPIHDVVVACALTVEEWKALAERYDYLRRVREAMQWEAAKP